MIKKQTNQELIIASLLDLLENAKPFTAITVQDIAENCGISRRTFYNTFRDKYDVVARLYLDKLQPFSLDRSEDYYTYLLEALSDIADEKKIWRSILRDPNCCQYLEQLSYDHQVHRFETTSASEIDPKERSLLRFYILGFFRTFTDWILNGCQTTVEQLAALLADAVPLPLTKTFGLSLRGPLAAF